MENSFSVSSSEPTVSGSKSIFKKPANTVIHAFEVSLNESTAVGIQHNKSDLEFDGNVTTDKVPVPFKKPRKTNQESFNISTEDSMTNSDVEKSVSFVKPKSLFKTRKQPTSDPFHVSFNETITSTTIQDGFDKSGVSVDEEQSTFFNKSNPFKRKSKFQDENVESDGNLEVSLPTEENNCEVNETSVIPELEQSEKPMSLSTENTSGIDSTTFLTKSNPFKKGNKSKNVILKELQVSITDENVSRKTSLTDKTFDASVGGELDSTTSHSKTNPFKRKESGVSKHSEMEVSSDEEHSLDTNVLIDHPKQSLGNLSFDKNQSKLTNKTNNSGYYHDQSSINDENLNHWMSDHSDEELHPPTVPAIASKLSFTKDLGTENSPEQPPDSQTENSPDSLSAWEKEFNDIVSKSKKLYQLKNSIKISNKTAEQNVEPLMKKELTKKKTPQKSDRYKPPRLIKPASFATRRLYKHIINKLEPKYGIDATIEAENLVSSIADTVKKVVRRKTHQKKLIQDLKKEMAKAGLIETTVDFYEFVIKYLPYDFRVKTVPCVQPVTNTVYPPKDVVNPFEKIL